MTGSTPATAYDGFVCDLDGVVYRGPAAVPGAVEALRPVEGRVVYATNNASRPPSTVAAHLAELGLAPEAWQVATSSQAGAGALRGRIAPGARVLAVGGEGVALALTELGFTPVPPGGGDEAPCAAVLQGYGPLVTAADLARAAYEVEGGAPWVATNVDLTLPTDRGIAPGNGSLVGAVANAVGHPPHVVAGKPYADLYRLCAERLGAEPSRLLALGDRLDTDIEGAVAAGMDSLLVLTGVDSLETLAESPTGPTYLAPDLRALHEELPRPTGSPEGEWRCGAAAGRLTDAGWEQTSRGSVAQELTVRHHALRSAGRLRGAAPTLRDALSG